MLRPERSSPTVARSRWRRSEWRPPLVAIRALSKYYTRGGQIIPVLVDINLDVHAGDFVALMGPSGSGKTTLLNLIAGIDKPRRASSGSPASTSRRCPTRTSPIGARRTSASSSSSTT